MKLAFAMDSEKTRHVLDEETSARLGRICDVVSVEPLR
jgi:hypothetical protein